MNVINQTKSEDKKSRSPVILHKYIGLKHLLTEKEERLIINISNCPFSSTAIIFFKYID